MLVEPNRGTATDDNYEIWPVLTSDAVEKAEAADPNPRRRVFALAITRTMQDPPLDGTGPTLWSHALDQLAFHRGQGRLMLASAGNARVQQWLTLAEQYPSLQLTEQIHQPAQASNALTVGAYTTRVTLPPSSAYSEAKLVASRPGGIAPCTSTGLSGTPNPIKPEIVLEGGNLAVSGPLTNPQVPTLCGLTTSHRHNSGEPLTLISMTSEATARAANLAARIWKLEPSLRPETLRGLLVHSASWTPVMEEQFPIMSERLRACGYGVPDESFASECAQSRATVIIEDAMPNAVPVEEPKKKPPKRPNTSPTAPKDRHQLKIYRLPVPQSLISDDDPEVALRVTLSYFAEPNKYRRTVFHGLDLKWDMQGPQEDEDEFLARVNLLKRPTAPNGKRVKLSSKKSFDWKVGVQLRSRGTVQSDRWRGRMSALAGDKLIAVVPVLGWWDRRKSLIHEEMHFSLIVSLVGPGVYAAIKPHVEAQLGVPVEV